MIVIINVEVREYNMNEPITKAHLLCGSAPICRKMPEESVNKESVNVVLNDKSIYNGSTPYGNKSYIFTKIELNESEK